MDGFGQIFIFRITNKDFKDFLISSNVYWVQRRMRVNPKMSAIVDVANNRGVSL